MAFVANPRPISNDEAVNEKMAMASEKSELESNRLTSERGAVEVGEHGAALIVDARRPNVTGMGVATAAATQRSRNRNGFIASSQSGSTWQPYRLAHTKTAE